MAALKASETEWVQRMGSRKDPSIYLHEVI